MANLADSIEAYLLRQLEVQSGQVELQRAEVAREFACVPSQVTYVLATRFTLERGFVVHSRRGGGGFVRITRLVSRGRVLRDILAAAERGLAQAQALDYLDWLRRDGMLTAREVAMAAAALDRSVLGVQLPERDRLRGRILTAMIRILLLPDQPARVSRSETGQV